MKYSKLSRRGAVIVALTAASVSALAEQRAPVQEVAAPARVESTVQQVSTAGSTVTPQTDMYYQLQVLQEEIRQLRGTLEQASYEIQQLKQRQMDDYLELDKRIGSLQSSSSPSQSSASTPGKNQPSSVQEPVTLPQSAAVDADKEEYSAAYMLLRDKKIPESMAAFKAYIARYPEGTYVANSYYWLGETNVLTGNLDEARRSFAVVVDKYPLSRKSEDASLGLAKVYFQQGEKAKARELLEKVATGTSRAATKANSFLKENF